MLPKVKNLLSPKTGKAVPNQFVISCKERTIFQSYETLIAVAMHDIKTVRVMNKYYSRTTSKYTNEFLNQYKNYTVIRVDNLEV